MLVHRFPRPVHHRIPNFVDAEKAAQRFAALPEFAAAKVIKVNPDTPQKMVCQGCMHPKYTHLLEQMLLQGKWLPAVAVVQLAE